MAQDLNKQDPNKQNYPAEAGECEDAAPHFSWHTQVITDPDRTLQHVATSF